MGRLLLNQLIIKRLQDDKQKSDRDSQIAICKLINNQKGTIEDIAKVLDKHNLTVWPLENVKSFIDAINQCPPEIHRLVGYAYLIYGRKCGRYGLLPLMGIVRSNIARFCKGLENWNKGADAYNVLTKQHGVFSGRMIESGLKKDDETIEPEKKNEGAGIQYS